MKLEQPRPAGRGDLAERVAYLEGYLYRMASELQIALNALEQQKGGS